MAYLALIMVEPLKIAVFTGQNSSDCEMQIDIKIFYIAIFLYSGVNITF